MTIFLFRFLGLVFVFLSLAAPASGEDRTGIQVFAGGRSFNSFEAYTEFRYPSFEAIGAPAPLQQKAETPFEPPPEPEHRQDVAGVTPSLSRILREFQDSSLAGRPVCARDHLVEAIRSAAEGKKGPLLLVADGTKVRIMELKPEQH